MGDSRLLPLVLSEDERRTLENWARRRKTAQGVAPRMGISPASVRIWHAFGLQPYRTEDFKISPDPLLIDKIRDIVGLYLAPPDTAAVFAADEEPQI